MAKKNGSFCLVQDFRALNAQTHTDKYSMKDVSECIGEIGRSGCTIFSTTDLTIDALLHRLIGHGIKINLEKCVFGSTNVSYLSFRLTEEGIKPGSYKLKAVSAAKPPSNVHEIRQFLRLCNFFQTHVRNFPQISRHLTALTRKDSEWKKGPLPPLALQAFCELQTCLCSEPIMDYPHRDRPYALICDAALGDNTHPGGLGAILTQIDKAGEQCVIAYASS